MELRFREAAIADLRSYIANYASGFFELYRDTGLWNEDEIIAGARRNAEKLYDSIFQHVAARLGSPRVIGRKATQRNWQEIDLRIGSRLIIVHYSEEAKERIRWVESMSIDRKPIIF